MLDTPTPSCFPSCNSSPTQLPRHPQFKQTRRQYFDHNFFIRHQNGEILDLLERERRRHHFGSGPNSRSPVDLFVTMARCCITYFRPTLPCIESGLKPKLWAPSLDAFQP